MQLYKHHHYAKSHKDVHLILLMVKFQITLAQKYTKTLNIIQYIWEVLLESVARVNSSFHLLNPCSGL